MPPPLPEPILFHPLKHHLGYILGFVQESIDLPEVQLQKALRTIGGSQLDLYIGPLTAQQLSEEVILYLQERDLLQPEAFREHLAPNGYRTYTLSDKSVWAMRWGVHANRHVHLHPGRYSLHTLRVKANHLKTAIAVAVASIKYGLRINLELLNQVRAAWLALPPVPEYTAAEGLGKVMLLLQSS
ncbi:hypothetical protein [uncultured Pontibacter sp.]|uniref:hypothetical protein n=1 Tax=uncultured Pontibacter sp. TaxID=453356 RepID=UPI002636D0F6|nr:hypothetical protein [uncultured Pontibacter sp.]